MAQPELVFGSNLGSRALGELLDDGTALADLLALEASLVLAALEFDPEWAATVRRLNDAGVPLVAVAGLPLEQGYFANLDNASDVAARYGRFQSWTRQHGLRWAGVGLDVEPSLQELQQWAGKDRGKFLLRLPGRLLDTAAARRGREAYVALVARMRADGYPVETYQWPFIVDERRVGSTLLQRLFRIVDVPADREVLMLYSSWFDVFRPGIGPGVLWSYAPQAGAIAVGSTGGDETVPSLTWEEFARDLRLAHRRGGPLFVFSLEGCAQQGFLSRLRSFDWDGPVEAPVREAAQIDRLRAGLRAVLWASAHPWLLSGAALAALAALGLLARRRASSVVRPAPSPRSTRLGRLTRVRCPIAGGRRPARRRPLAASR